MAQSGHRSPTPLYRAGPGFEVGITRLMDEPQAWVMAETSLLMTEIEDAITALQTVLENWQAFEEDPKPRQATVNTALIRYAVIQFVDCFGRPRAHQLMPPDVFGPYPRALDGWEYLCLLRNTWSAHNIGALRRSYPVVHCTLAEGALRPHAVSTNNQSADRVPPEALRSWIGLMNLGRDAYAVRLVELQRALLARMAAFSPEQIAAMPEVPELDPHEREFPLSRHAFLKARAVATSLPPRPTGAKHAKSGKGLRRP